MSARPLSVLVVISSVVLVALTVVAGTAQAVVTFTYISAGLTAVNYSSAAWGDYDGDGDQDVLLSGYSGSAPVAWLYRNSGGVFTEAGAGLPGVRHSTVAWGDYDGDGDLDILLSGDTGSGYMSSLYRNDAGVFSDIGAGLPGVTDGSSAFGDYDSDGDLDILLTGDTGSGYISQVYRNDAGVFSDIEAGLTGVIYSAAAWGDYDDDGDLDLLLTGATGSARMTRLYRNDGGVFSDISAGLVAVKYSAVAWGDYDSDGDLDVLLEGDSSTGFTARVYRNDGGSFSDIGAGLPAVRYGAVAWGDYDNDGALDFVLTGETGSTYVASVYHNDGGVFSDIGAGLPGTGAGAAAWGDYDNDGDLDLLLTGWGTAGRISRIFRSDGAPANTLPSAPGGLSAWIVAGMMTVCWTPSADAQTPVSGLLYNLRIGTTPGGAEIMPAMSDLATGYRRVVQLGNAQQRTAWTVAVPSPTETYYWSVQAVDGAMAGSAFATEESCHVITFTDVAAGVEDVAGSSVAWGDYDNDGDLDILLAGYREDFTAVSRVYRNDGGVFGDIAAGLEGVGQGSVAWGDYDNDGDLDILLSGDTVSGSITRVYRNDAGVFSDVGVGLTGVRYSAEAWGDYDSDGDLDILLSGDTGSGYITRVYRNDVGVFSDVGAGLAGVAFGSSVFGDYDNDGDLDILLNGDMGYDYISRLYRNDAGSFSDIEAALPGVASGSSTFGDYDNDGDLDILLNGDTDSGFISRVYRNDAGAFSDIEAALPGVAAGLSEFGDYDNDGDLDVLVTGLEADYVTFMARIYRSDGASPNTRPTAPTGLSTVVAGTQLTLSWNGSLDAETPLQGLSYNIRIGTSPGGTQRMSPMSDATTGYRRVVQLGNAQQRTSWTLTWPPDGLAIYWSVQAVDGAFTGSAFAPEVRVLGVMEGPQIEATTDIPGDQGHQVRISWVRSTHDSPESPPPIVEYSIFRRIDEGAAARSPSHTEDIGQNANLLYPPGTWDFIASVPADAEYRYSMVVPTLVDSGVVEGMQYSVFFVRARTATPGTYFDSAPDSGYSVDNLAPGVPGNLHFSSGAVLAWNEALEEDFDYFAIYGSSSPGWDPTAVLIGHTTGTTQDISGNSFLYYHVTAIDFAGNEGDAASIENEESGTGETTLLPTHFALRAIVPNPAVSGASVNFDLPKDTHVTMKIFDVGGRVVATLVDGQMRAGRHTAVWEGAPAQGRRVAAGLYLCRMEAGEFTETRRIVIAH